MTKIAAEIANIQRDKKEPRDKFEADVRRMLKRLLPRRGRAELAAALSDEVGRKITKTMVDSWVAESRDQPRPRFSLSVAKALTKLIADRSLTRYLNTEEELTLIAIGEHARANKKLLAQIATPKAKAGERKR